MVVDLPRLVRVLLDLLVVDTPVNLDDTSLGSAGEVENEWTDRVLPAKPEPAELVTS